MRIHFILRVESHTDKSATFCIPKQLIYSLGYTLHSDFLQKHIKRGGCPEHRSSWGLVFVRKTQTGVENKINYPEVCLSGLAGKIDMPRMRTQHKLRDYKCFSLKVICANISKVVTPLCWTSIDFSLRGSSVPSAYILQNTIALEQKKKKNPKPLIMHYCIQHQQMQKKLFEFLK